MQRFWILWLSLAAAGPATSWAATSTSGNLAINVTPGQTVTNQTIEAVQLSGSSVQFGASGPYYVGTLSTNLSPQTPTFNYLSGASYQLVASGSSCSGGDTTHFQISGDGVYTNALAAGTYTLCITASATGVIPVTTRFAGITEGNKIDAAASYCAANGGGNGTSASPWQAACIRAAVNAAVSGDTVFLASGNWALTTTAPAVVVTKSINLVGAGSGNTFDAYGHPNNANGSAINATTSNNITRIFTIGPYTGCSTSFPNCSSATPGPGGSLQFGIYNQSTNCTNVSLQHIAVDGSVGYAGGDRFATGSFLNCQGPILVNDIRALSWSYPGYAFIGAGETQFNMSDLVQNAVVQSSVFAVPAANISGGNYPGTQTFQITYAANITLNNDYFYQMAFNPIYVDGLIYTGTQSFVGTDSFGNANFVPAMGPSGCQIGHGAPASIQSCVSNRTSTNGNYHYTVSNSYFNSNFSGGSSEDFSLGVHLNDPGSSGGMQDLNFTGNTVTARNASIASCDWHFWDPGTHTYAGPGGDCVPTDTGAPGMQINGTVNADCTESDTTQNNYGMNVNNNSIVGTYAAVLDAAGTGMLADCWINSTTQTTRTNTVVNFRASKNYLSSPHNAYNSSAETHNPTVAGNYCAGGTTFAQTDSTQCATTGFTQPPTGSFTLSPLGLGGVVPFNTTSFTAQYGAVRWLASTSSTTPSTGDSRWSYVPPFSLSATHGNTVYLWVMDSANHISAAWSALVP